MNCHRPYCSQPAEKPDEVIRADTRDTWRFSTARQSISYATGLAAICVRRNGVDSMYYVHPDRLGSYTHITTANKQVIRNLHFDPWGNVKNDTNWRTFDSTTLSGNLAGTFRFSRGFTGHEHYADLKIINMNGRLYDPVIAPLFSPDNFVQVPEFTQN